MANFLTWEEVGEIARGQQGTDHQRLAVQHMALLQAMADSPCPVCHGLTRYPPGCLHCGKFPESRRGHFAIDAPDAFRRVKEDNNRGDSHKGETR